MGINACTLLPTGLVQFCLPFPEPLSLTWTRSRPFVADHEGNEKTRRRKTHEDESKANMKELVSRISVDT